MKALNDVEELIVEYEIKRKQQILQNRRIRMSNRRKTFNEAAFIITNLAIEASFSQSISHQSEIEVCISRRITFRSTISVKREASRR